MSKKLWLLYRRAFPSELEDFTPLQYIIVVLLFELSLVALGVLTAVKL